MARGIDQRPGETSLQTCERRIGAIDVFEELISQQIEGEILGEGPGYSVHVSSDPTHTESRMRSQGQYLSFDQAIVISRFHRMVPAPDAPHPGRFKSELEVHGRYTFIPVSGDIQPQFDCAIEKKEIRFSLASLVTKSDRDAVNFLKVTLTTNQ